MPEAPNPQPKPLKSTLNLPQTAFPMKANLPHNEPLRLAAWQQSNLYGQIRAAVSPAVAVPALARLSAACDLSPAVCPVLVPVAALCVPAAALCAHAVAPIASTTTNPARRINLAIRIPFMSH